MKDPKKLAKRNALKKEKVIKRRIEMLLKMASICFIAGIIIGIILPIGGVKKSEYKSLKESNKTLEENLKKANEEIISLKSNTNKSDIYTSLSDEQKQDVLSYIEEIKQESTNNFSKVETTEMFKILYKGYAYSVGYIPLEDFKSIVDTFGFTYNVVDGNKFVFKDDNSGDVVKLSFSKIDDNNEYLLSSILYERKNKHIEIKDNNSAIYYKTYNGTEKTVDNINDQIEFLFSE